MKVAKTVLTLNSFLFSDDVTEEELTQKLKLIYKEAWNKSKFQKNPDLKGIEI